MLLFPTGVGVILKNWSRENVTATVLHVCGGDPCLGFLSEGLLLCSPRVWGWSFTCFFWNGGTFLFPTCVGVILALHTFTFLSVSVPHGRGGDPNLLYHPRCTHLCSPRVWGWSPQLLHSGAGPFLFPTCVGVIPFHCVYSWGESTIPHVRGGDPAGFYHDWICSSRMWGWSRQRPSHKWGSPIFPTCVGVIRRGYRGLQVKSAVPHACGGDPYIYRGRFFLFPA